MDKSNGYERISQIFATSRGIAVNGIGSSSVRKWAKSLNKNSVVLDLGCGTGVPVSKILIEEGMIVYGIDASLTLTKVFHQNFPNAPVACEAAEDSSFFNRTFDAIIAWGLLFILPEEAQLILIDKMAAALNVTGKLIFTSPPEPITWFDAMSEVESRSLGAKKYRDLISESGLTLIEEFEDEGENHYYSAAKM